MAHTQADLDTIKAAIASGQLSGDKAGRRGVARSIDDLRKARDDIAAELAAPNAGASVRRGTYTVRFATHRGD